MARKGIDLYNITSDPEDLRAALAELRSDFDSHNHDGSSTKSFETIILETLRARAISIKKGSYSDNTAGLWEGIDSGVLKMNIGDGTNYMKWTGTALTMIGNITATTGTIGGWTIGSSTLKSAATGARVELDAGNTRINLINANGDTVSTLYYGTATTNAIMKIAPTTDARRGLEFVIGSTLGADAKCITIDNPSTSICIDMTDAGSTGINIAGHSTSAITITHSGTAEAISISASGSGAAAMSIGGGNYPCLDLTQNGTDTNSYGMRITDGTAFLKSSLYIDNNANSHLSEAIEIERDGATDNQIIRAISIKATNSGVGDKACGIDFTYGTIQAIMNVAVDATDPTGGGGAATGRIPIYVAGVLKYLAYY